MFYFWECIANELYKNDAVLPALYQVYIETVFDLFNFSNIIVSLLKE